MGKEEEEEMPSQFRCPISLDLMKYPVSLSTGVTYDLSSIQRWLDSGQNTCPATMQVLPSSPVFVPNLTLLRLIHLWSHSNASSLLHQLSSSPSQHNNVDPFLNILCFASHSPDNARLLSRNHAFLDMLVHTITRFRNHADSDSDVVVEAALNILREIARSYNQNDAADSKSTLRNHFLSPESLSSAGRILKFASRDSKIAVADLIQTLASDPDSQIAVLNTEQILTHLIRGLDLATSVDAFLSCILSLSGPKLNKQRLVRAGAVRAITRLLSNRETGSEEAAMKLLEGLLGCSEGRSAICGDRECIAGVVARLMRAPESGIAVLWSACCWMRDRRAREALAAEGNATTRILVVMQSGCSPAAKRMCGELLRVFRGNPDQDGSCLGKASYDTHSTHIMPF